MSLAAVSQLLNDVIGLDVTSIGESLVRSVLRQRQLACNMTDLDTYIRHLQQSTNERQELIEAVVVPETWFFRDREAFAALTDHVLRDWLNKQPERAMRLLSVPCATGEEPYTVAMALMDGGLTAARFHIDAIDISHRLLTVARRAVYGRGSFRGRDLGFRERFFAATSIGHHLAGAVRRQVSFRQGNLLSMLARPDELYDVVFCRNLLIYFDTASRARVLATLASLLKPGGFLFVGAAEAGVLLGHGFEPTKWPMSFSFRKDPVERSKPSQSIPLSPSLPPRHVLKRSEVAGVRRRKKPEAAVLRTDGLAEAQRLADQGRIEEAAVACQAHLRLHGPSAPAFYLFGLLRDACGNSVDAETYYRKALYLDPEHNDAIMHLALLMDGRERPADALVLRKRAKRLTSKSV